MPRSNDLREPYVCVSTNGSAEGPSVATHELLEQIRAGDEAALAKLYDSHSRLVYSLALKALCDPAKAEAVLHDVFLKVWRQRQSSAMGEER